jgi:hypothetical protein
MSSLFRINTSARGFVFSVSRVTALGHDHGWQWQGGLLLGALSANNPTLHCGRRVENHSLSSREVHTEIVYRSVFQKKIEEPKQTNSGATLESRWGRLMWPSKPLKSWTKPVEILNKLSTWLMPCVHSSANLTKLLSWGNPGLVINKKLSSTIN